MYCKNCGAELDDGAKFCGNCGAVQEIEQNPFEGEQIPHMEAEKVNFDQNSPEYTADTGSAAPAQDDAGANVNSTLWLVLAIIQIVTCCATIPGIIGLVMAILSKSSKSAGRYAEAAKYCKYAKIAVLVGIGLLVLSGVISAVSGALYSFADNLGYNYY